MKKSVFLMILFVFSLFLTGSVSFAQKNAGDYMNIMSKEFDDITNDMWDYTSSVAHSKSARKVENRRKDVLKSIMDAQKRIAKMPDFEGDKALRDSVLSFLKLDYYVINDDYAKIVDMEELAEQSYDLMEAYMTAQQIAGDKLDKASEMVNAQVKLFAALHNVKLVESKDKISRNLEIAGKAFAYYNKIYLIFFKSYKQEAYMIEALNKGDVNGLKQNLDALAKTAAEGLQKLDTIKAFKNDVSLKTVCKELLNFYKTECTKAQALTNFTVKKENFEKLKKAFEAKSESSRTKADVDEFNAAVNDMNKASAEYTKVNNELGPKREALMNKWNTTVGNFMNSQVPKKK